MKNVFQNCEKERYELATASSGTRNSVIFSPKGVWFMSSFPGRGYVNDSQNDVKPKKNRIKK